MPSHINKTFTSKIQKRPELGWIHVVWPESVSYFGSTKAVKVSGTIDGVAFQTAFMPWGDGTQFLPVSAKLLKAIKKQVDDTVQVHLEQKLS